MTDIARLGLAIDSTSATGAAAALDRFQKSAQTAAQASDKLAAAAKPAAAGTEQLSASAGKTDAALKAVTNSATTAAAAINNIAKATSNDFLSKFANDLSKSVGAVNDNVAVGQQRIDQLRTKYNPLFAAQQQYKQQLGDLKDAYRSGALSQNEYADALTDVKIGFIQQVEALRPNVKSLGDQSSASNKAGVALNSLTKAGSLTRAEMINLSRQLQDVGVSLVSGQSPFMVLAQQGAQIADIFGSSKTASVGGAFKQVAGGIASVLTPLRLAAAGFAGLAIGGVIAVKNLADSAKQFDDVSRAIGTTTGQLHSLQQAAAFKGIGQDDFFKAMQQLGGAVYDAQHNMGGLADVMRANGKSAKDFNGYLEQAADLIKNATSDQQRLQLLQQMGLPATMDWVRFLSQGKDGIRAATDEATKFNASAEGQLVASARKFDEVWDKATTNMVNRFKAGILEIVGAMANVQVPQWLQNLGRGALGNLSLNPATAIIGGIRGAMQGNDASFADRFGSFAPTGNTGGLQQALTNRASQLNGARQTEDPTVIRKRISDQLTYLGALGQTITSEEAARQVQLQADLTYQNTGVKVAQSRIDLLKQLTREQVNGVAAIKSQTDAEKINAATIGLSVGATAEYTAVQNALNDAKRAGRVLSADDIASIKANAAALGQAAQSTDNLRFAYSSLVQGPLQTFTSALGNGAKAWDAFKQAGQSALNSIASKLADMAAQNLWGSAFGGSSGGGLGGILGSLFGGGGGGASAQAASAATLANNTGGAFFGPGFAGGGFTGPGGKFEPAGIVHKGEYVMDAVTTRRVGVRNLDRLRGYASGGYVDGSGGAMGAGVVMQDNRQINIGQGASAETVVQLRQELERDRAARYSDTVKIVQEAKKRRVL